MNTNDQQVRFPYLVCYTRSVELAISIESAEEGDGLSLFRKPIDGLVVSTAPCERGVEGRHHVAEQAHELQFRAIDGVKGECSADVFVFSARDPPITFFSEAVLQPQ